MSNIEENLAFILSSRYGKDVRQAIHDAIHDCYEDGKAGAVDLTAREQIANLVANEGSTEKDSELVDIRVGVEGNVYSSAGEAVRGQIRNTLYSMPNVRNTSDLDDFNNAEFNKFYLISTTGILNRPSNNPGILVTYSAQNVSDYGVQLYYTISSNRSKIYIRSVFNGTWFDWKEMAWTDDISEYINNNNIINTLKINLVNVTSTSVLDDFNNAKTNTVYMISTTGILNRPSNNPGIIMTLSNYIETYDSPDYGVQLYYTISSNGSKIYIRSVFNGTWFDWRLLADNSDLREVSELNVSLFETIGIVGDSYASGVIYKDNTNFVTNYGKSWPQILARDSGVIFTNFSAGGLSTRSWLTNAKGLQLVQSEDPKELYGLFLGINDCYHLGESYLGSISDITGYSSYTQYPDTFYGNYGKIIEQIAAKAPNAFMIISTMANNSGLYAQFNTAIEEIAEHYNIPVIKQHEDPYFLSSFYLEQMIGGHPIAINYSGMAKAIRRMIENCLNDNPSYFNKAFSE